jgi:hypothetical protein
MSERDREFLRYYKRHRIDDQQRYYFDKSAWHQKRANALIWVAGILMFLTSATSAAVAQGAFNGALWPALATVIPAISGAIVSIRALYEFERNHARFLSTYYDLRQAAIELRPGEELSNDELREATVTYVMEVENLLSRENRQFVKLMSAVDRSSRLQGE